jgi:hypothetical protein
MSRPMLSPKAAAQLSRYHLEEQYDPNSRELPYSAAFRELPACIGLGTSPEAALEELFLAMAQLEQRGFVFEIPPRTRLYPTPPGFSAMNRYEPVMIGRFGSGPTFYYGPYRVRF